jgi:hypothetical protein
VIPSTQIPISVDKPNWEPLERVLPLRECSDFIYMGHAGEIELYKHYVTRRLRPLRGMIGQLPHPLFRSDPILTNATLYMLREITACYRYDNGVIIAK